MVYSFTDAMSAIPQFTWQAGDREIGSIVKRLNILNIVDANDEIRCWHFGGWVD